MEHLLPISSLPPSSNQNTPFRPAEAKRRPTPEEETTAIVEPKGSPLQRIKERGYLKAAVKSDVPGFGYRDPGTGEYSGLEIDLARAIAKQALGDENRVRFYSTSTEERFSKLHSWFWGALDSMAKLRCILLTAMAYSSWWYLGMAGKLPSFLCPEECWHKMDYIGLDYYYGIWTLQLDRIGALLKAGQEGNFSIAPVWPGALYSQLVYLSTLFSSRPDLPILILENGCVDRVDTQGHPIDRRTYICQHVQQVQRAVADGINVKMYIYWSLTTNREWGFKSGPGTDFGLFGVKLDRWIEQSKSWEEQDHNLDRKAKEEDVRA
jgi:hypothetical protein